MAEVVAVVTVLAFRERRSGKRERPASDGNGGDGGGEDHLELAGHRCSYPCGVSDHRSSTRRIVPKPEARRCDRQHKIALSAGLALGATAPRKAVGTGDFADAHVVSG